MTAVKSSVKDVPPCVITYEDGYEDDPDLANVGRHLQDEEREEAEVGRVTK
jgi:hypothetical protein